MRRAADPLVCQIRAIVEHVVSEANDFDGGKLSTIGLALHESLEAILARQAALRARNQAQWRDQDCAVPDHHHLAAGHDADSFDDFFDGGAA